MEFFRPALQPASQILQTEAVRDAAQQPRQFSAVPAPISPYDGTLIPDVPRNADGSLNMQAIRNGQISRPVQISNQLFYPQGYRPQSADFDLWFERRLQQFDATMQTEQNRLPSSVERAAKELELQRIIRATNRQTQEAIDRIPPPARPIGAPNPPTPGGRPSQPPTGFVPDETPRRIPRIPIPVGGGGGGGGNRDGRGAGSSISTIRPSSVDNHATTRTPGTSGANAPVTAGQRPRPARPSTWGNQAGTARGNTPPSRPGQAPRGFPRSAGAGAGAAGAAGGLAAFGLGVAMGTPAPIAAGQGVGGALGSLGGAALGTPLGPVGMGVGGVVGGALGGSLGGALGGLLVPGGLPSGAPSPSIGRPPIIPQGGYPFQGGQRQTIYSIEVFTQSYSNIGTSSIGRYLTIDAFGPIGGTRLRATNDSGSYALEFFGTGDDGAEIAPGWYVMGTVSSPGGAPEITSTEVTPRDGQSESGNPARRPAPAPIPPRSPRLRHPGNSPYNAPAPAPVPSSNHSPGFGDAPGSVPGGYPGASNRPRPASPGGALPQPAPGNGAAPAAASAPGSGAAAAAGAGASDSPAIDSEGDEAPSGAPRIWSFGSSAAAPSVPPIPALIPTPETPTSARPQPSPNQQQPPAPPPTSPQSPCASGGCGSAIRQDVARNRQNMQDAYDRLNAQLNALQIAQNAAGNSAILNRLNQIDAKLGAQIPDGGLSGYLQKFRDFTTKVWRASQIDRAINAITLLVTLHNAALLSSSLAQTLGELTSTALDAFGIRDEENNPLDINQILTGTMENLFRGVLGDDLYDNVSERWAKANRIVRSASNILWSVRGIMDSSQEVMEWTAENTGKIGNALKRWGVVGNRAYPWMAEKVRAQDLYRRKLQGFMEGAEGLEDAASSLQGVLSEVRSIQYETDELLEQSGEFMRLVTGDPEQTATGSLVPTPDYIPIQNANISAQQASESPELQTSELSRGEA